MFLLQCTRQELLGILPKRGAIAEIGVAKGGFSVEILKASSPSKLHLIDPWKFQDVESYLTDGNNVSDDVAQKRFEMVTSMFQNHVDAGRVIIHRAMSGDIVESFDDGYFDYVYVDGNHTYEAVLEDLTGFAPKVRAGGAILGHDFADHSSAKKKGFGVVPAVQEFCSDGAWRLVAVTLEPWPTYMICRSEDERAITRFRKAMIAKLRPVVDVATEAGLSITYRVSYPDNADPVVIPRILALVSDKA